MPDRPESPGLVKTLRDLERRLTDAERQVLFPNFEDTLLEVLENRTPIGTATHLDFGAGLTAVNIGDHYIRVTAAGSIGEFDAIVDGMQVATDTTVSPPVFLDIGEACTYLKDELELDSVNILVRSKDNGSAPLTYTETANWSSPGQVHLFALRGSLDDDRNPPLDNGVVRWNMGGFRPTNAGGRPHYVIQGFSNIEPGVQTSQPFETLELRFCKIDDYRTNVRLSTFLVAIESAIILRLTVTLCTNGWYYNTDVEIGGVSDSGSTTNLGSTSLVFQGNLNLTGGEGGTHNLTLPVFFTVICTEGSVNRSSGTAKTSGRIEVNIPSSATGRFWNLSQGDSTFDINATSSITKLDLKGDFNDIDILSCANPIIGPINCDNLTLGAPAAGNLPGIVTARVDGTLDVSGVILNVTMEGSGTVTIRSQVGGTIVARTLARSSGTWLNFVAAVAAHLMVIYDETQATGTAKPYDFDGSSRDCVLIMQGTTEWPVSGTGAGGTNDNVVFPEDYAISGADAAYILKSILEDKGDLITATADDTPTILGVGADDEVLIADSTAPGGLKWGPVPAVPGGTVDIEDEGTPEGAADTIDFTGSGVSVTFAGGTATVDVPGGGSGVDVSDEGTPEGTATELDFTGDGVDVSFSGGVATIDIPGGGGSIQFARTTRTSSDITVNSTSWINLDTGLDITFTGVAEGDWVEVTACWTLGTEGVTILFDVVSVVAGSPVNSWGENGAINATGGGIRSWGISSTDTSFPPVGPSMFKQIVAGDLSAGSLTLRLRTRTTTASNRTVRASTVNRMEFLAKHFAS